MTETKRKKVSILEICSARIAEVNLKIKEAQNSKIEAEANLQTFDKKLIEEIENLRTELSKTKALIAEVLREGLDSQKLDKKIQDIASRITSTEDARLNSPEIKQTKKLISEIEAQLKHLDLLNTECQTKNELAKRLKNSHEIDKSVGADLIYEFETLDEAVSEYIRNIPIIVSISDDMFIDRVALWCHPAAEYPEQFEISPKKGQKFKYKQIPQSLNWLRRFENSIYTSMPQNGQTVFNVKNTLFVVGRMVLTDSEVKSKNEWMVESIRNYSSYEHNNDNDTNGLTEFVSLSGFSLSARSGLCYIRNEDRFYSVFSKDFQCIEYVKNGEKRSVEDPNRRGVYSRVDVTVPQIVKTDMSQLMNSLNETLDKKIPTVISEFSELQSAKSDFGRALLQAISEVGVLESGFEHRGERLDSKQIADEIGAYWDAFIAAPWESTVVGSVAMIKHLCERKIETPHVWSYPIKGHYGLRVRTRDHDWIIVQIYCPPQYLSPKTPIKHSEVEYSPSVESNSYDKAKYVTVGPCFLAIYNSDR
jgi:hypothetical protein